MQTIGDLFNIVLFLTAVGSAFTLLSLAAGRLMRRPLPLWFCVCGMALYLVPPVAPGLYLIPQEDHSWVRGYDSACIIWFCGVAVLTVLCAVRAVLARQAVRNYRVCTDERINALCARCAGLAGLNKTPLICFGTLKDPACTAGIIHPAVILNEAVIRQLTGPELMAVLCHEMTHIRRGHILLQRMCEFICILHWMNPLVWTAKRKFTLCCELDCDRAALACLENHASRTDYAGAMLRLLELSTLPRRKGAFGMSALGYPAARRRMEWILSKREMSGVRKAMASSLLAFLLAAVVLFSVSLSREHFYPYPARQGNMEYSSGDLLFCLINLQM